MGRRNGGWQQGSPRHLYHLDRVFFTKREKWYISGDGGSGGETGLRYGFSIAIKDLGKVEYPVSYSVFMPIVPLHLGIDSIEKNI